MSSNRIILYINIHDKNLTVYQTIERYLYNGRKPLALVQPFPLPRSLVTYSCGEVGAELPKHTPTLAKTLEPLTGLLEIWKWRLLRILQ